MTKEDMIALGVSEALANIIAKEQTDKDTQIANLTDQVTKLTTSEAGQKARADELEKAYKQLQENGNSQKQDDKPRTLFDDIVDAKK